MPGMGGEAPSSSLSASPIPPGRPMHCTPPAPPFETIAWGSAHIRSVSSRSRPATRYGAAIIASRTTRAASRNAPGQSSGGIISRANANAMRYTVMPKQGTPQPSRPIARSSARTPVKRATFSAIATCTGWPGDRYPAPGAPS